MNEGGILKTDTVLRLWWDRNNHLLLVEVDTIQDISHIYPPPPPTSTKIY